MLYLYAITEPGPAPIVAPFQEVVAGELSAVVEPVEGVREATPEALWAHEHAVEAVMATRPVLPVRFGTRIRDADALVALLADRAAAFRAALEHVRGHVEIGVRILWDDDAPEPAPPPETATAGPGRQYLLRRLAETGALQTRQARAEARAQALIAPLIADARDHRSQVHQHPRPSLNVALLVPGEAVEAAKARVEAIASQHPHLRILCTGPWPPYSFTETG